MARMNRGIFGGLKGKIGNLEGFVRNGVGFIRTEKRKSKVPRSVLQQTNQSRMAVVNKFINTMTPYVKQGFEGVAAGKDYSANNAAKSYQLLHSLQEEPGAITINYAAVQLTRGKLILPENLQLTQEPTGVRFTWSYNAIADWYYRLQQVMVLVYIPLLNQSYFYLSAARRTEGTEFMELPLEARSLEVHAYLSFVSDDRKQVSNTAYLGSIIF